MTRRIHLDSLTIAGLALLLFFTASVVRGWAGEGDPTAAPLVATDPAIAPAAPADASNAADPPAAAAAAPQSPDPLTIAMPYDEYFLTQSIHGASYGHAAIDIAAGNGATIRSIINGTVTGRGYDQWGNSYLQIENEVYTVLIMHGQYTAVAGDVVAAGTPVGTESNIGYTLDLAGNSCAGRDCGYHTHLNIFDKRLGVNIDPLSLIPANYP